MIHALRQRLQRWIASRTPRVPGPWRIHRRRIYIVPTRYGYGYGLLLFTMLLGAMNYSNSMAFALTFLLAGIGLLAMHDTHANLVNLSIAAEPVAPVFAGDALQFGLRIDNASRHVRHAIRAHWPGADAGPQVDIPASSTGRLVLPLASTRRGWLPAPRFAVATVFPLGLFHAWSWVELDIAGLVYPKPAAGGGAPPPVPHGEGAQRDARAGIDSFVGLRSYRPGDPLQAIHWKTLARQPPPWAQPQVKQFAEPSADTLWLDWQALPADWPVEQRLAQLARWVLDAEAQQRRYGLRLPRVTCPPGSGSGHRHACLAALALF